MGFKSPSMVVTLLCTQLPFYLFIFWLLVKEFIMQLHKTTVKRGQFRSSLSKRLTFTPFAPYCLATVNHSIYFYGLFDSSLSPPSSSPHAPHLSHPPRGGGICQTCSSFLEITLVNGASYQIYPIFGPFVPTVASTYGNI